MPSRQDQLHSYQFMVQRVVAALVMRETDPAQSPFRRAAGATLASLLIAAIAIGGAAVYGLFAGGGGTGWRDPGVVIVEKETGARYVYRDGKLHAVLNYASALLIVEAAAPKTMLVSRESLEGVPRGTPLGIPNAPDSLPAPDQLANGPWTVCSFLHSAQGRDEARSVLAMSGELTDGEPLGDAGVLAVHPEGELFLLWQNRRYQIRNKSLVLAALTWTSERPVTVAPALLNALPAGADLGRIPIPGRGAPSAAVPGATIGEVFVVERQGGGRQYAVARRDGLSNITELQANLILTDLGQDDPTPLSQARFAELRKLPDLLPTDDAALPATTPKLVRADQGGLCGQVRDEKGVTEVRVGASVPELAGAAATGARSTEGGVLADHVLVPPGRGLLVEAVAAPGAEGGTVSVVTDLGRRHALATSEVQAMLGYGAVAPVRMPASLVSLIPAGRALDPSAAKATVEST
jgi:type VII secretion protein EccB